MHLVVKVLGITLLEIHSNEDETPAEPWDSGYTASTPIGFAPTPPPPFDHDCPERYFGE